MQVGGEAPDIGGAGTVEPETAAAIGALLRAQRIAALGTLHRGQPFVSMVPFALQPNGEALVIHVSRLATHTQDMIREPRVSLMVLATTAPDVPPQATARLTIQADACACPPDHALHDEAKRLYLARFPDSAPMFEFADFLLFVLRPVSARWVGGFGKATSLLPPKLSDALRSP